MKAMTNELYGMIINIYILPSAYVNECKFKEAYQIIENRFNKPGLQEKYKEVFSFFEHIDNI